MLEKSLYKMDNFHGMIILLSNIMINIMIYSKMLKNQIIKMILKKQKTTSNKIIKFNVKRKIN
jgi:hypothetical protein